MIKAKEPLEQTIKGLFQQSSTDRYGRIEPMTKKYKITKEEHRVFSECHRIRALRGFNDVKKGALGGFIEDEDNLCHSGSC
ncbi:hypothetical protein Q7M48_05480 (plasmid) [Candidatus Liberibacter asiaticus]|uniref:hypothetical protein n=1 Tax=Liberibacter asiaticus TaxID=34021 RepID=UPI00044BA407|nr:hypothetical protein [Candidatus Liberibacter asiaticus]ALK07722.1 hypothetical protein CD16_05470 [Candidatus Liberibacter asiaticus]QNF76997.1 hypothetical protein FML99_05540 [Candidatus Liberibacter asiaticus]UCZ51288.1 hypothetical protein GE519_05540 [Candidatus Liberibacter asiaticus]WCM57416.1 hypothetical protein NKF51_05465 [Candidatus Liberibacter asiaticus]WLD01395.1 hypothetical protein PY728_05500 [Candidatus Liberibacter asiaticus]